LIKALEVVSQWHFVSANDTMLLHPHKVLQLQRGGLISTLTGSFSAFSGKERRDQLTAGDMMASVTWTWIPHRPEWEH